MDSHRYDPFAQGPVVGTRPHTPPYGMAPIQAPAPGRPMTPPHGFPPPRLPMAPMPAPAAWTTAPAPGAVPRAPEAPTTANATPPPTLGSPKKPRPKSPKLIAAAVALALTAGAGTGAAFFDLFGSGNEFQTVAYAGKNPFTSPVGADRPGVASIGGGTQPSDSSEMYAQDPAKPACDSASLVKQLKADPKKAAAWAQVQRIAPAQLSTYVDGLTPVTLRANTAVVDHSYAKGTFQATPAVLAAGTAVFINAYGQPTVKCFSGNPLTPGESTDPAVTTVTPAAAPISTNVFHNVTTGGPSSSPGRPDTTGTGPNTGGGGGGGGNSGGGGGTTTPVTAAYSLNGDIPLSDGRLQRANGEILPAVPLPEGATRLASGGWTKDGKTFNRDGSELKKIPWGDNFITPEGKLVDAQGNAADLGPNTFLVPTGDGTWTWIRNNDDGTYNTFTFPKEGTAGGFGFKTGSGTKGKYDPKVNGFRVPPKDEIQNLGETPRPDKVTIPGVGTVGPDNTTTPEKKNTLVAEDETDATKLTEDDKQTTEDQSANKEQTTVGGTTGEGTTDGTTDGTDPKIDPVTGFPIDPVTGFPTDPATGQAIDPATGQPIDPATGLPIEQAPVEQQPIAPAPVEEAPAEVPVEQAPVEQAPVEEAPAEQAPAESSSSSGSASDSSSGGGESSGSEG